MQTNGGGNHAQVRHTGVERLQADAAMPEMQASVRESQPVSPPVPALPEAQRQAGRDEPFQNVRGAAATRSAIGSVTRHMEVCGIDVPARYLAREIEEIQKRAERWNLVNSKQVKLSPYVRVLMRANQRCA